MRGSKRKGRRPGTWELRVDAGRDPLTGSRQQKSPLRRSPRRAEPPPLAEPPASPLLGTGIVVCVSDRPFISVDELEFMTPDERLAAVRDRVVTDLDELPDDFRRRIIATAQSLSDGPLAG